MEQAKEGEAALQARYDAAFAAARANGSEAQLQAFEDYVKASHLVMNRPLPFVIELATEQGVYPTFYQRRRAGLIFSGGDGWDRLREQADTLHFGAVMEEIRFAALTTEGRGLTSYGECTLIPNESYAAHRTSFSEENTADRVKRTGLPRSGPLFNPEEVAVWENRHQLSVVKAAPHITAATMDDGFPDLVLKPGATTDDDVFVEGHICFSLTIRSFRSVALPAKSKSYRQSVINDLAKKLRAVRITVP